MKQGSIESLSTSEIKFDLNQNPNGFSRVKEHWERCKKMVGIDSLLIEDPKKKLAKEVYETRTQIVQFNSFVREIPFLSAYGYWLQGISSMESFMLEACLKGSEFLEKNRLLPGINSEGTLLTLEEFKSIGHQKILEEIRCVSGCSTADKECAIRSYLMFSSSLARDTCNFIPSGFDPDRNLVRRKKIKYDEFFEFIQKLSNRDALIAKLLYFGAPSIESVLSLQFTAINVEKVSVSFPEGEVVFPKHLIKELLSSIQNRKEKHDLVFANLRGTEVERAHLNQSFSRASQKSIIATKITPGNLLRFENETPSHYTSDES